MSYRDHRQNNHRIRGTMEILRLNGGAFLRFEMAFKIAEYFLVFPLMGRVETLLMKANGVTYLSGTNYHRVLKNPLSWLLLMGIWIGYAVISMIELLGMQAAISRSTIDKRVTARWIFREGVLETGRLRIGGNGLLLLYTLMLMPITNIPATVSASGYLAVPRKILEGHISETALNAMLLAATLVYIVLFFRWIYTMPVMVTRRSDFATARRESGRLLRRGLFNAVLTAVAWLAMIGISGATVVGIVIWCVRYGFLWLEPQANTARLITPQMITVTAMCVAFVYSWIVPIVFFIRIHLGYAGNLERRGREPITAYTPSSIGKGRLRAMAAVAWVLVFAVGYYCIPGRYQQIRGALMGSGRPIMVMAHRGDSITAPENTLPALQSAIDRGSDAAEIDVQMTRDGVIVLMHDASLERTTGLARSIWEVDYDQIKTLDNGSYFSPSYAGTRIATLDEAMKLCKDKLYLNIEIKRTGYDDGIVQRVLEIIAANAYEENCDITSMDYATLAEVRALNPDIYTVYTTVVGRGALAEMDAAMAFSVERTFVNAGLVNYLHNAGKGIYVWTVNRETDLKEMIDLNVDALITDRPELARKCLEENNFVSRLRRVMF